jgi:hypothetical protein
VSKDFLVNVPHQQTRKVTEREKSNNYNNGSSHRALIIQRRSSMISEKLGEMCII